MGGENFRNSTTRRHRDSGERNEGDASTLISLGKKKKPKIGSRKTEEKFS